MKDEIIQLLKSQSLKDKIRETKYEYSDNDLLAIAYHYAPNYNEKLRLLTLIVNESKNNKTIKWAKKIIEYETRLLKEFQTAHDDEVFEAILTEKANSYDERYLARTYQGALDRIKYFYEYFEMQPDEKLLYRTSIIKRKIYDSTSVEDFKEDILGKCFLNGAVIENLYLESINNEFSDDRTKNNKSIENYHLKYPKFVNIKDLVSYTASWNEYHIYDGLKAEKINNIHKLYGIYVSEDSFIATIQLLDTPYVKERSIDSYKEESNLWHDHVEYPLIEKEDLEKVPDNIKEDYYYLLKYVKVVK